MNQDYFKSKNEKIEIEIKIKIEQNFGLFYIVLLNSGCVC